MSEVVWNKYSKEEFENVMKFSDGYIDFLSDSKTERACVKNAIALAKSYGYRDIKEVIENKEILKAQDKVYVNMMNKSIALMHIGSNPLEKGMNILGAHIDSPRLDLKQNPLYEDGNLAYLDTHYYGGVKKYQWVTLPLAIHGVVCLKDGTTVDIAIGDKESDPVFVISDLLIHLSADQLQKKANEVIAGEDLNVTVGSIPLENEEKDAVKANVAKILKSTYGFEEDDFVSAELEVVPAGRARSCGFDSSMVLGYGHDDRICAYTSLVAQLEAENVKRTAVCLLVDKDNMANHLVDVCVLKDNTICWMKKDELDYAYRHSIFQSHKDWTILVGRFQLEKGNQNDIRDLMDARRERRMSAQPLDKPCAGSVFRNPEEIPAWKLIEDLGLRGHKVGGAKVSEKHCNFIVNDDLTATAQDVRDLIHEIKVKAKKEYDIDMVTEVEQLYW